MNSSNNNSSSNSSSNNNSNNKRRRESSEGRDSREDTASLAAAPTQPARKAARATISDLSVSDQALLRRIMGEGPDDDDDDDSSSLGGGGDDSDAYRHDAASGRLSDDDSHGRHAAATPKAEALSSPAQRPSSGAGRLKPGHQLQQLQYQHQQQQQALSKRSRTKPAVGRKGTTSHKSVRSMAAPTPPVERDGSPSFTNDTIDHSDASRESTPGIPMTAVSKATHTRTPSAAAGVPPSKGRRLASPGARRRPGHEPGYDGEHHAPAVSSPPATAATAATGTVGTAGTTASGRRLIRGNTSMSGEDEQSAATPTALHKRRLSEASSSELPDARRRRRLKQRAAASEPSTVHEYPDEQPSVRSGEVSRRGRNVEENDDDNDDDDDSEESEDEEERQRKRNAKFEYRLEFNSGSRDVVELLAASKNIIQGRLTYMPPAYVARFVYDPKHYTLVSMADGKVVGCVTFRLFAARHFVELVFCTVDEPWQGSGVGKKLMNRFKDTCLTEWPGVRYILTYADNSAIKFFSKCGYTRNLTMDDHLWRGYIKDYENATLMQCELVPGFPYSLQSEILKVQTEFVVGRIRQQLQQQRRQLVRHKGLPSLAEHPGPIDAMAIPGIREAGWTPQESEWRSDPKWTKELLFMVNVIMQLRETDNAQPFLEPVDTEQAPDYYSIIKHPMDLRTMERKVHDGQYPTLADFEKDVRLMIGNALRYNDRKNTVYTAALALERQYNEIMRERIQHSRAV